MAFVDPGDLSTGQVVPESWMDTARADLLDLDTRATAAQSTANTGVANAATADAKAGQVSRWTLGVTTPAVKPMLILALTGTQSIANNTDQAINWQTATVNTGGITWSSVTNPSQITITRAGVYTVSFRGAFASNTTNFRAAHLSLNGTGTGNFINGDCRPGSTNQETAWPTFSKSDLFAVNDVLRIQAWQNTGAALNLEHALLGGTKLSIVYEGPVV